MTTCVIWFLGFNVHYRDIANSIQNAVFILFCLEYVVFVRRYTIFSKSCLKFLASLLCRGYKRDISRFRCFDFLITRFRVFGLEISKRKKSKHRDEKVEITKPKVESSKSRNVPVQPRYLSGEQGRGKRVQSGGVGGRHCKEYFKLKEIWMTHFVFTIHA